MSPRIPATKPSRAERDLARAIARRCRGRTALVGPEWPPLVERLQAGGILPERVAEVAAIAADGYDTIVLFRAIEAADRPRALQSLRAAFAKLAPGGALLVCVSNADLGEPGAAGVPCCTRASLKRLLKKIDQPKEFTDQPFGWLLMALRHDPPLDRAVADRCREIATLCRGRVLELGCGPGHLSAAIAARGLEVYAIDKNEPKIALARARYPGVTFRQADILDLPELPAFDTVVLAEVLEHVPEESGARMLDVAWSFVSRGGRLVVSVPNEDCIRHRNHVREFTVTSFVDSLSRFGVPRVATTQPLRWLLASVDRPAAGGGCGENGS